MIRNLLVFLCGLLCFSGVYAQGTVTTPVTAFQMITNGNLSPSVDYSGTSTDGSSGNITLSGTAQTLDGLTPSVGKLALLTHQTSQSQNGPWVVQSGAWTRPQWFPSGAIIAANCVIKVTVTAGGNTLRGNSFVLITSSSLTIDSSNQSWGSIDPIANKTEFGMVKTTSSANVGFLVPIVDALPTTAFDCTDFSNTGGDIGDDGNPAGTKGGCVISDASGWPILNTTGTVPTVSTCGSGALTSGSSDEVFEITSIGAATTACTLTFGAAKKQSLHPICTGTIGTTPTPFYVSTFGGSASNWTSVTLAFASSSGTLRGICH